MDDNLEILSTRARELEEALALMPINKDIDDPVILKRKEMMLKNLDIARALIKSIRVYH